MNATARLALALPALSAPVLAQVDGVGAAGAQGVARLRGRGRAGSLRPFTGRVPSTGSAQRPPLADECGLDAALGSGLSAAAAPAVAAGTQALSSNTGAKPP